MQSIQIVGKLIDWQLVRWLRRVERDAHYIKEDIKSFDLTEDQLDHIQKKIKEQVNTVFWTSSSVYNFC